MSVARSAGAARTPGFVAYLVLALVASAVPLPAPAKASGVVIAAAVPDGVRLAGLRKTVASAPALRVVGVSGTERIPDPVLDSSGVRSTGWKPDPGRRTALLAAGRTAPVAARDPIPWSEISALEVGRSRTLQGAVGGTLVGFVVGAGIALAAHSRGYESETDAYRVAGIVSGTTVAGTLLGAYLGHRSGFRPIYRANLGFDADRVTTAPTRAPHRMARLAAGVGAALAWDLADLPRRRARLPEPVGGFTAGATFASGAMSGARGDRSGAAIDALIGRWNTLYPPYALEGMNDH